MIFLSGCWSSADADEYFGEIKKSIMKDDPDAEGGKRLNFSKPFRCNKGVGEKEKARLLRDAASNQCRSCKSCCGQLHPHEEDCENSRRCPQICGKFPSGTKTW